LNRNNPDASQSVAILRQGVNDESNHKVPQNQRYGQKNTAAEDSAAV